MGPCGRHLMSVLVVRYHELGGEEGHLRVSTVIGFFELDPAASGSSALRLPAIVETKSRARR